MDNFISKISVKVSETYASTSSLKSILPMFFSFVIQIQWDVLLQPHA